MFINHRLKIKSFVKILYFFTHDLFFFMGGSINLFKYINIHSFIFYLLIYICN